MFEFSIVFRRISILLFLTIPATGVAGDSAMPINRAAEVVDQWKGDQHLYVKGNLGVSAANLDGLEKWLDQNAANWTVVLMQNASGEEIRDGGDSFSGMDAVEHGLGKGLPAKTGFGSLRHKISSEPNGAFFVLFLKERKFSYFASDVYDKRGLGEDRWLGNLDVQAIRAMRSGGRIVDAVQNTISSIDAELQRRFDMAAAEQRRAEEEARRLKAETGAMISEMRQRVAFAADRAAGLRRDYPNANGALTSPANTVWLTALESAQSQLAVGNVSAASAAVGQVKTEIDANLREVARHAVGKNEMADLRQKLDAVRLLEQSVAAQAAKLAADDFLRQAEVAHQNAEPKFSNLLDQATRNWSEGLQLDQETRRMESQLQQADASLEKATHFPNSAGATAEFALAKQALAQAREKFAAGGDPGSFLRAMQEHLRKSAAFGVAEQRQAAQVKAMAVTGGSGTGAAALLFGWLGNRRRRKVRQQAEQLLSTWETAFAQKTDGLFTLLDRAGASIGTAAQLEKSGWTGETQRLASQAIADVDQLFVMSSSVDRVLDQARKLVHPGEPMAGGVNLVSGKNYERAIHLLTEAKIEFGPDDPLQPILNQKTQKPWSALLGKREDCAPFALSFDELIAAFDGRAQRAVTSLETIDQAWGKIHPTLNDLDALLDTQEARERAVHFAGKEDGLFQLDSLFDALLPAARKDEASAVQISATDPVQALAGHVSSAKRKAADADALCDMVEAARRDLFPVLANAETTLQQAKRQTAWIGGALRAFSTRGDELGGAAVENSVSGEVAKLGAELQSLTELATKTVFLQQRGEEQKAALEAVEKQIATDRESIAGQLGISTDLVLREAEWHPDKCTQQAREEHLAALVELDRGAVAAGQTALEEMQSLIMQGTTILNDTKLSLQSYATDAQQLAQEHGRISALRTPQLALLAELQKRYAVDALTTPHGTLALLAKQADARIEKGAASRTKAQERHFCGNILTAARLQESAGQDQKAAEFSWMEIPRHAELLAAMEQENRSVLETLEAWQREKQPLVEHPHTRRQSMAMAEQAGGALAVARRAVEATGQANHPAQARKLLADVKTAQAQLEGQISADHALFQTAKNDVAAAADQLQRTNPAVQKSQTDQIRDSAALTAALQSLAALQSRWEACHGILETSHAEWADVLVEAGEISREAARQRAILQGELEKAAEALHKIRAAAATVNEGAKWRGFFTGNPGSDGLRMAETALGQGDYASAIHHAVSAERQARAAIEAAEAEQRRRRAEQRRREEENERWESAARSSFSSSLGSSSSSSSRRSSGSSSSSGSSRSSFSSGSGTSRSGW